MDFGIVRLSAEQGSGRRYHLFDGKGKLRLVADYASPWLPTDDGNRVRFAKPGGQVVASLDLPEDEGVVRNGRIHTSYALILDHAVYAILNKYEEENSDKPPFFTIEADGMTWLAWNQPNADTWLDLYNEIPTNLMVVNDPIESAQITPVGALKPADGKYNLAVTLPVNPFHHADVIILALIFLFDPS